MGKIKNNTFINPQFTNHNNDRSVNSVHGFFNKHKRV